MRDTFAPASVDDAFGELAAHRDRVRALADLQTGETRELLLAEASSLEQVERRMRLLLGVPLPTRPGPRRDVGEDTSAWVRGEAGFMRRNRGPQ